MSTTSPRAGPVIALAVGVFALALLVIGLVLLRPEPSAEIVETITATPSEETATPGPTDEATATPAPSETVPPTPTSPATPTPEASATPVETTPSATAVTCGDDGTTIADWLQDDGRFTSLLEALEQTDLLDMLDEDGTLTLFAADDDAFAAMTEEEADQDQRELLLGHLVDHVLLAADLEATSSVTAMNSGTITISMDGDTIVLNGEARIIEEDNAACNGVVHVIDAVLGEDEATGTP